MLLDSIKYSYIGTRACSKVGEESSTLTARLIISEYESEVSLQGISALASFTYSVLLRVIALLKSCSRT